MEPMIEVKNVTMKFNMMREKVDSIKEYLIRFLKRQLHFEEFIALDDVSLVVERGDIMGIVGLNGAGKSTLLKVISGIIKPTTGAIRVYGSIAPLIELGAGFDHDLTARENVYLNGAVLGYSKRQMNLRYDEIIEFAELEDFQDVALKNFSSGMTARLGFAIATITKPDILIVDEILGVGDFLFREKSEQRIRELMSDGVTVLMVSHSLDQIKKICKHAIWLDHGKILMEGEAAAVVKTYEAGASR